MTAKHCHGAILYMREPESTQMATTDSKLTRLYRRKAFLEWSSFKRQTLLLGLWHSKVWMNFKIKLQMYPNLVCCLAMQAYYKLARFDEKKFFLYSIQWSHFQQSGIVLST